MSRRIDLTGKVFGRLSVIGYHSTNKRGKALWLCKCDCGNETVVIGENLRSGKTTSCGCYNREMSIKANRIHGMTKTRIYECWLDMKKRCNDLNNKEYHNYGERGIRVCEEWEKDFKNFYDWSINNGYNDNLTIDRIDVNGDYEPSNCRWVTWSQQAKNKRLSSKNKYGASGIVFDKNRNVYRVRIGVNGKRMFVGDFKTLEEAIARRREAEKIYWGVMPCLKSN